MSTVNDQEAMLRQVSQRVLFQSRNPQPQQPIIEGIKRLDSVTNEQLVVQAVTLAMVAYGTISATQTEYKTLWHAHWTASNVVYHGKCVSLALTLRSSKCYTFD